MNATVSNKITILSYTVAISFVVLMIAASVLLHNQELILPEVAAMAVAMWVYREPGWIRRSSTIFIAPTVTAVIGLVLNQLQIAYIVKVILTLMLIMLFLRTIRSNLAPSIATGILPLAIDTDEWSFVVIVFIFTITLMIGVLIFGLNKGLAKKGSIQYRYMLVFLALSFCWIGVCWVSGYQQIAVIPPIYVVVFESLQKPKYNGQMALKQGLALTLSVTIGALVFFRIELWVFAALVDMILMLALSHVFRVRIPAIYAFPLLTFVFPEEQVMRLPLVTLAACLFMFTSVLLYKKVELKRTSKGESI
ncbi:hypothetical protein EDM56_20115 [Brevibacillus fluminis]|uniref:HPP family protein n=1 Tax=Brevibacillus fluminis TaxID=511487 RepID=A0A3M8DC25_9BACL|nr:hypothetical protein [Brevibacillus fluminis]RNB84875.1 hypothetical protein EDM56_20115 [Brevibacillus fluminis]